MNSLATAQSKAANTGPETLFCDSDPIPVLVVDDSAFMRKMVSEMVASDPCLKLSGVARDGVDALKQIDQTNPRVITLDIEMPQLDGFGVLKALAERGPDKPVISVVVLSSLTQEGAEATLKCLNMGAVDFVGKPSGTISLDIELVRDDLLGKLRAAGQARSVAALAQRRAGVSPRLSSTTESAPVSRIAAAPAPPVRRPAATGRLKVPPSGGRGVLVIGASTGGPRALQELFACLRPERIGLPIVIVQHMPPRFTASLASHLQEVVGPGMEVFEAREGDKLQPWRALIAPGGNHLVFNSGVAHLTEEPLVHGVRPSVDVTMTSLAQAYKDKTLGVLLTGMGRDGARAMKLIHDLGGYTLAEDEESCVVYGMPKAAVEMGGVDQVVPLADMAEEIMRMMERAK
jgi:two-component system chemotaxis response regulator CheB